MNFFSSELLQAAFQTFCPSFVPVKALRTSHDHPTTYHKQTHVLRTNPNRVPMPTERAATTTAAAVSVGKKQRENRIDRWLDKNDHMASDPIEVRSYS
jgi:hypothetical protein